VEKRPTQSMNNPFPLSDSNKRYYTYDFYLKRTFGGKCIKVPLDAGMTCPNIDGTCGRGGCIYCSPRGSGDNALSANVPLDIQYIEQREKLTIKWPAARERCIAYFQAHTNTYAPLQRLKTVFEEALTYPGVVGLNIATRADCLAPDVLAYLAELSERTVLTLELGLQSSNDATAARINRGHTMAQFCTGFAALRKAAPRIQICTHVIFGLPGETEREMMQTIDDVARLHPDQIKIHLLHVLRGTRLGTAYEAGEYRPMERADYVRLTAQALTRLPGDVVICRLTGDGQAADLLAPIWSRNKITVLNDIDAYLYERDWYQGIFADAK